MNGKKQLSKAIIGFVLAMVLSPLVLMGIFSILGEGKTYEALGASIGAKKAFDAMLAEDYMEVSEQMGFWGESEDEINLPSIQENKKLFAERLKAFFSVENREMTGYDIVSFDTDDGYTIGTVCVTIQDGDDHYNFAVRLSKEDGKLCPMDIPSVMNEGGDVMKGQKLADQFIDIIRTNNPG